MPTDRRIWKNTDIFERKTVEKSIHIKGARVHNLKNIEVRIPHDRLVVVTGLSGSGKSTLAFDTIFAEGQRRYVESLSAYARQFLGRINKPDVDLITGIAPAIAIQQQTAVRNTRDMVLQYRNRPSVILWGTRPVRSNQSSRPCSAAMPPSLPAAGARSIRLLKQWPPRPLRHWPASSHPFPERRRAGATMGRLPSMGRGVPA